MMEQGGRPCYIDLPYPQVTPAGTRWQCAC